MGGIILLLLNNIRDRAIWIVTWVVSTDYIMYSFMLGIDVIWQTNGDFMFLLLDILLLDLLIF